MNKQDDKDDNYNSQQGRQHNTDIIMISIIIRADWVRLS